MLVMLQGAGRKNNFLLIESIVLSFFILFSETIFREMEASIRGLVRSAIGANRKKVYGLTPDAFYAYGFNRNAAHRIRAHMYIIGSKHRHLQMSYK